MIDVTREERHWLLNNMALAMVEQMGAADPPVPIEDMLRHPPPLYQNDFGVVDLYSNLWDATFARPLNQRGNVFVRMDLPQEHRRYALAREMLCALITSKHGQALGLGDVLMPELRESSEFFAGALLAPEPMVNRYRNEGGNGRGFASEFQLTERLATARWSESGTDTG